MELPPEIFRSIEKLSREGNSFLNAGSYDAAISKWQEALRLLPSPTIDWEAALWLYASIGDANYTKGDFEKARDAFLDAYSAPGGTSNAFVLYRLGQCEARLRNLKSSTDYLLRAYMLDGTDIFDADDEGEEFLRMLNSQGVLIQR